MHNQNNQSGLHGQSREEKVKKLAELLANSKAAQKAMPMSVSEWEAFLSEANDQALEDGFEILREEAEMREEIGKERLRKKEINKTRFLQKDEQLKVEAQELINQGENE